MDNIKWAEREVRLACEKENPNLKDGEWDYGCACYSSALKAYKALMESIEEDGHSGFSWSVTQNIISRLMQFKPLTPIEDTEDVWSDIICEREDYTSYQCNRKSSLFKDVYKDGRIVYTDTGRAICYDFKDENSCTYVNSFLTHRVVDDMFPITMPYMPPMKPYKMFVEELYLNRSIKSDYDTKIVRYIVTPEGERIQVDRYFSSADGKDFREITEDEFMQLRNKFN